MDGGRLAVLDGIADDSVDPGLGRHRRQSIQIPQLFESGLSRGALSLRTQGPKREKPAVLWRQNSSDLPSFCHCQSDDWTIGDGSTEHAQHGHRIGDVGGGRRKFDDVGAGIPAFSHQG